MFDSVPNRGARGPFVMYVRSQPREPRPAMELVSTSVMSRLASTLVPPIFWEHPGETEGAASPPSVVGMSPEEVDRLPEVQLQCVVLVLDAARRIGGSVRLVDISRPRSPDEPPGPRPDAEEFFPILIRPDGARLAGELEFTPGKVRKFLKHP